MKLTDWINWLLVPGRRKSIYIMETSDGVALVLPQLTQREINVLVNELIKSQKTAGEEK